MQQTLSTEAKHHEPMPELGQDRRLWVSEISSGPPLKAADPAGNVGIGTTSPAKTLDVSGTAQIVNRTMIGGTGTPSATLQVSGTLLLAGTDGAVCDNAHIGILQRNPTTGQLQVCK